MKPSTTRHKTIIVHASGDFDADIDRAVDQALEAMAQEWCAVSKVKEDEFSVRLQRYEIVPLPTGTTQGISMSQYPPVIITITAEIA